MPGELSPFLGVTTPVPAPTKAPAQSANVFAAVETLDIRPKQQAAIETGPSPEEIAQIRAEAAEAGFAEGHAAGVAQGQQDGYQQGMEQGRREAFEAELTQRQMILEAFANALQATVDGLNDELGNWLKSREDAMAEMAMDVVRRIVGTELQTNRDSALAITREALGEVTHATHARIRLNPFDIPALEEHRAQILAASGSLRDIDVVEDSTILGGCRIETDGGMVDATIDSRLQSVQEAWQQAA
jgi:flagellar assembly protein FliH